MKVILILLYLLLFGLPAFANVSSINGSIIFDSNFDGSPEAILNNTGFGLGTSSPSSNLQIQGNALITGTLTIGSNVSTSTNLMIFGTFAQIPQSLTAGTNAVGHSSIVLVDSSQGDVTLTVPSAASLSGQIFTIKRVTTSNNVVLLSAGNLLDRFSTMLLPPNTYGAVQLISNGSSWYLVGNQGSQTPQEVGSANLFVYWPLENTTGNTLSDLSGGAYDGTLLNQHQFAGNSVTGVSSLALKMDEGKDEGQKTGLIMGTTAYSYAFWINSAHAAANSSTSAPIGKAGFCWGSTNTQWAQSAFHQASDNSYTFAKINATLSANTWYHIASTWDGSSLKAYLNGAVASTNSVATWKTPAGNIHLCNPGTYGSAGKNVLLDDTRFYSKALSPQEVLYIYQAGNP